MAHEITEKDNMFSVGETPWHKIGVVLDSSPSIEEAIKIAKLDWTVEKREIRYLHYTDSNCEYKPLQKEKAIIRNDTQDCLGVVGDYYTPLQNIEAFNVFAPLIENKIISLETAGSLKGGEKVWILARINGNTEFEIEKNDSVKLYCLLSNSHNGKSSLRFGFTPIRVVCNNTLTSAVLNKDSKLIRIFHSGNVKDNVEKLRDTMNFVSGQFEMTCKQYELMAKKKISKEDLEKYVKIVFGIKESMRKNNTLMRVINRFDSGIGSKINETRGTVWQAYNAINEFLLYESGRNESNRLDSLWFGINADKDKKAFDEALKLVA